MTRNHCKGIILWIDDVFASRPIPRDATWSTFFGRLSDRVFRLMDLSLEVATTHAEALAALDRYDRLRATGTLVFAIVDLTIPANTGGDPEAKYGVATAKTLQERGYPFAFLSANTDASQELDKTGLGIVPYYVKESSAPPWRIPNALATTLLGEFRNRITWLSVENATAVVDVEEAADRTLYQPSDEYDAKRTAFAHFPYFGQYRDFVERSEYRNAVDMSRSFAVRSARKHADEFVEQCLLILFYPSVIGRKGKTRFRFGYAHDANYLRTIVDTSIDSTRPTVSVVRICPDHVEPNAIEERLSDLLRAHGTTLFVVPNDESFDPFIELFRQNNILTLEELPYDRIGDQEQREQLIRRSSELVFQRWGAAKTAENDFRIPGTYLQHPELLTHPLDWTILLEPTRVAEKLSDPFETVTEFGQTLFDMPPESFQQLLSAFRQCLPVPYESLLRVGFDTFRQSEFADAMNIWLEESLDSWLTSSWQFPYGLRKQFGLCEVGPESEETSEEYWCQWQDAGYEVLVGLLEEFNRHTATSSSLTPRQEDLRRVTSFVRALGGRKFLTGIADVDWDALELLRWPHLRYPMPMAIKNRLQKAGKHLWIQPEGLDLAKALPTGQVRYRMLVDIVEQYWDTLIWAGEVASELPKGWSENVAYLSETIRHHRVAREWSTRPRQVWDALLGLLRNAGPVMFITDQVLRGKPISGGARSIEASLSSIHGYGALLGRLRGSRRYRIGQYLVPRWPASNYDLDVDALQLASREIEWLTGEFGASGAAKLGELERAAREIIEVVSRVGASREASARGHGGSGEDLTTSLAGFFGHAAWSMTESKDWHHKGARDAALGHQLPSLLGTKADYLWLAMDSATHLELISRRYRYFDGYHFLAALGDLRIKGKDTRPQVPLPVVEQILDLFVASIEGILTQLAWCVKIAGHPGRADAIRRDRYRIVCPDPFEPPTAEDLAPVLTVRGKGKHWEVFTLGIPGEESAHRLCYHHDKAVLKL